MRIVLQLAVLAALVPRPSSFMLPGPLRARFTRFAKHDPYRDIDGEGPEKLPVFVQYLEDRWADGESQEIIRDYLDVLLDGMHSSSGLRVLEIGSGTGAIVRLLARRDGLREVVGLEPSEGLVDAARHLTVEDPECLKKGVKMTYRVGCGESIPFYQESFDLVIFHTTLMHISPGKKRIKVMQEAARVLKQGGRIGVFDYDRPSLHVDVPQDDPLSHALKIHKQAVLKKPGSPRQFPNMLLSVGLDLYRPWTPQRAPVRTLEGAKARMKDIIRYCVRQKLGINAEIGEALNEIIDERFEDGSIHPLMRNRYGYCIGSKIVFDAGEAWCDI